MFSRGALLPYLGVFFGVVVLMGIGLTGSTASGAIEAARNFSKGRGHQLHSAGSDRGASHLQIVAHPDDDLIFFNPDLAAAVNSGVAVTSVYLTSGESDVADQARYAASRQAGTRAAFARMARVPDEWQAEIRHLLVGGTTKAAEPQPRSVAVQWFVLRARPHIQLVFLNLPEDNNPRAIGGKHALTRLWTDRNLELETLVPAGSSVSEGRYRRDALVTALREIVSQVDAGLVNTQDPLPDRRFQPQWSAGDHSDHIAAARFAEAAYRGSNARMRHYRGYNTSDIPANLSGWPAGAKRTIFAAYARHDPVVSVAEPYAGWLRRMRYRDEATGVWAARDRQGRLAVIAAKGGRAVLHREGSSPRVLRLDVPVLDSSPSLVRMPDGRLLVLVQQATGAGNAGDIFAGWLPEDSGSPAASSAEVNWLRLGIPGVADPARQSTHLGIPVAAALPDGGVLVAVRDPHGSVSVREIRAGKLSPWRNLGGRHLGDGLALTVDAAGNAHVVAYQLQGGLLHWRYDPTTRGARQATVDTVRAPASPVGLIATPTGLLASYVESETGQLALLTLEGKQWRVHVSGPVVPTAVAPAVLAGSTAGSAMVIVRDFAGRLQVLRSLNGRWEQASPASPPLLERFCVLPGEPVVVALTRKRDWWMGSPVQSTGGWTGAGSGQRKFPPAPP